MQQMRALYANVPEAKTKGGPMLNLDTIKDAAARLLGSKAVWTQDMMDTLPDASFLFVEPGKPKDSGGKTVPRSARHFPVRDASGAVDAPHLRNAIARIPQSTAPGLDDAKKTTLQARARTMLEQMSGSKEASLGDLINEVRNAWVDLQIPESMAMVGPSETSHRYVDEVFADYVIVQDSEGLLKVPWMRSAEGKITFGEGVRVEEQYVPTKGADGGIRIYKQADGELRWVGWVSNHFRDNDNPPEILSGKAHREYADWATKQNAYPELWLWHQPGSKVGKADFVDFHDGFLMTSGTFTNKDAGEKLAATKEPLTMSHGFIRLKNDPGTNITDRYRMFEESIGPAAFEANHFTKFSASKEAKMLSEKQKAFLSKYLGEEQVSKIEGDTEALKSAAIAAGVDWKDVEVAEEATAEAPAATTEAATEMPAPNLVEQLTAALVDPLVTAISEKLQLGNLSAMLTATGAKADQVGALGDRIGAIEASVKALKQTDDVKIAAKMTPRVGSNLAWMHQNADSGKKETALQDTDEDAALKAATPTAIDRFMNVLAR